ncbi:Alpha/Beta hydrolase protein [Astrocystis sublimbata]|nr:Alpha/Beta hydrolase protein [Astrocystis sublimbata]
MAGLSLLKYLYYKALVSLIRAIVPMIGLSSVQRSRSLVPPDSRVERGIKIPSRDSGRYILADIYLPNAVDSNAALPVLVNWHGSGFIMPYHGSDAFFCSRVAREAGIAVLDVDYRKGPETPYPCAVNDAEDTMFAGSNIALVTATMLRKRLAGVINIDAVLLLYPLIDLAAPPETKRVPRPIRPMPPWQLRMFNDCYAPDTSMRTDPAVSGGFADVDDFPSTVAIMTCDGDVLKGEGDALGARLRRSDKNNRKIIEHTLEGVRHGFDNGDVSDGTIQHVRREELYGLVIDVLKDVFNT